MPGVRPNNVNCDTCNPALPTPALARCPPCCLSQCVGEYAEAIAACEAGPWLRGDVSIVPGVAISVGSNRGARRTRNSGAMLGPTYRSKGSHRHAPVRGPHLTCVCVVFSNHSMWRCVCFAEIPCSCPPLGPPESRCVVSNLCGALLTPDGDGGAASGQSRNL